MGDDTLMWYEHRGCYYGIHLATKDKLNLHRNDDALNEELFRPLDAIQTIMALSLSSKADEADPHDFHVDPKEWPWKQT